MMIRSTKVFIFLITTILFIFTSCSHINKKTIKPVTPKVQLTTQKRLATRGLTEIEARTRKEMISQVRYELFVDLANANNINSSEYTGKVVIHFNLKNKNQPVNIDFLDGKISKLFSNQKEVSSIEYNGYFLTLQSSNLQVGKNEVAIEFPHKFTSTGTGLHRFHDPEDNRVYLYSDFEPYDANQLFPCFDQPDLKATFSLSVIAPAEWTVISSPQEELIQSYGQNKRKWIFPESSRFSTYVFSLHAGPYTVWNSSYRDVKLRLFSRQSMAKYVDHQDWFKITKQGFKFFEDYFDIDYPFGTFKNNRIIRRKYDQIIVPDFNSGAMENVGAVTFNELFISRSKPTELQRERLADTILHELAHMWFGNLVTMRWWNGLWLNESFATYMANLALREATSFKAAWHTFFIHSKRNAYNEDQLITTHPIETQVDDTETAFANFDSITYGKGASVLKQLAFYIGKSQFREGVQTYLKRHSLSNAELSDFFKAQANASKLDLEDWTERWLTTTGVNSVFANYNCKQGLITEFTLEQGAETTPLKTHRTQVALFKLTRNKDLKLIHVAPIIYSEASTPVKTLIGKPCPDLVFPNYDDYDYAKVRLDAKSLSTAHKYISRLEDGLDRSMLWAALWEMVQDSNLQLNHFYQLTTDILDEEKNFRTLSNVLNSVHGRSSNSPSLYYYLSFRPELIELKHTIEKQIFSSLMSSKPGSDHQKLWLDSYITISGSEEAAENLKDLLQGELKLKGFTLDQDRRWSIVVRLNALGDPESENLVIRELQKDPSDRGSKMAISAEAARPDFEQKTSWFKTITELETKLPTSKLKHAMESFFPFNQFKFRAAFSSEFFNQLPALVQFKDPVFVASYSRALVPRLCTDQNISFLEDKLNSDLKLPPIVVKSLKIAQQEEQRCVEILDKFKQAD